MEDEVTFFNTQINSSANILLPKTKRQSNTSLSALGKVKKLKQHISKMENEYRRALSLKTRTQKSIGELRKNAQKIRVDFLKMYQNKKLKLLNKQMYQNFLLEQKQHEQETSQITKQRKLFNEYQLSTTRLEQNTNNQIKQEKNKQEKYLLQKEYKMKDLQTYVFAKDQYNKIRDEKASIRERNKKINEILQMRSQINYAEKVEKELGLITQYQNILKDIYQNQDIMEQIRPITSASKSFYVTARKINSTKQSRGIHTSQTAR